MPYPLRTILAPAPSSSTRGAGTDISKVTDEPSERMTFTPGWAAVTSCDEDNAPVMKKTAVIMDVYTIHLSVDPAPALFK